MDFYSEIHKLLIDNKIKTKAEIHNSKIELCRKYSLSRVPSDADILEHASEDVYELVEPLLRTKPMRTISGVAPVAVMTSPAKCPHGTCIYCPGGVEHGSAQSYTGFEPAALRAGSHDFNPYQQTRSRLEQFSAIGHPTDKIDLIIMGGTFTAREFDYQDCFIRGCFAALNALPAWEPKNMSMSSSSAINMSLVELQAQNETAPHRCIGMTIETRPDWCKEQQVDQILKLGGTRVELGVQTVFDDILQDVSRGHRVQDSIDATQILKDSGLKVCYHLMPGLPGATPTRDRETFDRIFNDPAFKPDMLKIYPTLVVKGTELYDRWRAKEYEPLDVEGAKELIVYLKEHIPPWVRIQRIQRDIPVQYIECGVDKSNLRQLVNRALKEQDKKCNCIRCREVGHLSLSGVEPRSESIQLKTQTYDASGGHEVFMSYEDLENNILIAFVRLRLPSTKTHRREFYNDFAKTKTMPMTNIDKRPRPQTAIIRELKVFGPMATLESSVSMYEQPSEQSAITINKSYQHKWQHLGYGKLLLEESEKYAKEHWGCSKLLIMSGVGVKPYYARQGYRKEGVYMVKDL